VESNLNIKKPDTPKLNVETVSSAVFGKDDGAGGGSGESIKNIHKTLSKLSGHIRKSLIRIKALEFNLEKITPKIEEVENKLVVNTEKTTEVENKLVVNTERIVKIEKILENKKWRW
jgi:predicted nuclease with TOPRIM domain